ncbi:MAG: twin-arginine translocase TatA/TatE family subunit [Bacteroidota bacterium]
MGSIGGFEMVLIFLVILLIFGAKRIPEIARGLGKGIREFKDATSDIKRELTVEDQPRIQQPRPPAQGTPAPRGSYSQEASSSKTEGSS